MIGVVIPAHNEEAYLRQCLASIKQAASCPKLNCEPVKIIVVLDNCSDRSGDIAWQCGVETISVFSQNVGIARSAGADLMIARGARWLAFTDADTMVSEEWLFAQLSLRKEAVCGSVQVNDWSTFGENADFIKNHFSETYNDTDGHRHIHGANFGVSTRAYIRAGGFPPLECSEDVALVNVLEKQNVEIAWSARPRVITSARRDPRAKGGFGDTLMNAVSQKKNLSPGILL